MIKIEISKGIYGYPEDGDVGIYFPPECSCSCYGCDEPCYFCTEVLKRFPNITGRTAMSYGVIASVDEFSEFLAEYRKEEK